MVSKEEALAFMMPHKQKPLAATRGMSIFGLTQLWR
ncbi:hypothetical protein E9K_02756 [Moraxella catarrhalis 103P14B1]|nr:hypothetical protein E9K_02756 [Moraxella catarrhalis 103P14B1]